MSRIISEKLQLDPKIAAVTVISTLLLTVDHYYKLTPYKYWDRAILYLLVPLLVTWIIFREPPRDYGMTLGDWRMGILLTMAGILLMVPVLYILGRENPAMQAYYGRNPLGLPWTTFLDLIGWEFMFRGWILFAYLRRFGHDAIWLQAVPFAMAHFGKPGLETFTTIFGGFAFGWVAYRTKSFIYPFLIHWFISTFMVLVALGLVWEL